MAHKEKTLIFLHIPKAAGSTLNTIIHRQFSANTIFNIRGDVKTIFQIEDNQVQKSINKFINLSEGKRIIIRCLKGHMPFGLHKYLPQPCTYITLLRNPVDRIISEYYYIFQIPHHYFYKDVTSQHISLRDFVCSDISQSVNNLQTRLLSGVETFANIGIGFKQYGSGMLERAKKNIKEHFVVVGLSEKFDESLVLFKKILGWGNIFYVRQNITYRRPSILEIDKDTIRLIEKYNELDMELYRFAEQIFERLISEQGEKFKREVKRFQLLNRYYSYYTHSPLFKIRRCLKKRKNALFSL